MSQKKKKPEIEGVLFEAFAGNVVLYILFSMGNVSANLGDWNEPSRWIFVVFSIIWLILYTLARMGEPDDY